MGPTLCPGAGAGEAGGGVDLPHGPVGMAGRGHGAHGPLPHGPWPRGWAHTQLDSYTLTHPS